MNTRLVGMAPINYKIRHASAKMFSVNLLKDFRQDLGKIADMLKHGIALPESALTRCDFQKSSFITNDLR